MAAQAAPAFFLIAALYLVVLHRSDGGDVTVNADQVTSLRSLHEHRDLVPGHCMVGLTDGKFVGVQETCAEVKRQLEDRR